jgi:hypothetical protein
MATLATWYEQPAGEPAGKQEANFRVREFPNEDIFLYVTPVDNSRVVRPSNRETWNACWRFITVSSAMAILMLGLLLPNAYSLLAGIELHSLQKERAELLAEQKLLETQESRMLRPERLEELAQMMQFVDPPPTSVVYLDPVDNGSVAKLEGGR